MIDEAVKANPDYNFVYPRQWDRGYMEQGGNTPQTPQMQEMYNKSRIPVETFFGNEERVPTELAPMPGDDRQINDRIRAYGLYMRDRGVAWPVIDKLVAGLRGDPQAATTALASMGQRHHAGTYLTT
jgi:hypothetical protein